ncbi:MAG: 1-(5-phosphoribosyl)-5-[(5-phosphoribosylamino) methylideneamino]imidazole-4-carboxamide isomerase [Acidobacteriaceae bacterium]
MLIPSIDLLGGKVVQLVQGERKALEFDSPDEWIALFAHFPIVQLIDLDAAMRTQHGGNRELVAYIASRLPVQVGGGIRSPSQAQQLLSLGAQRVIIGSALYRDGTTDLTSAASFHEALPESALIFAVDAKRDRVAIAGWKQFTELTPEQAIRRLTMYCGAFLYTHIDTEGTLSGFPVAQAKNLQSCTSRRVIVAGGIKSAHEISYLDQLGIDAVVGMALYSGLIEVSDKQALSSENSSSGPC